MHWGITFTLIILTTALSACTSNSPSTAPSLVGSWQGMREEHGKCQFLSWNTNFEPNGRFSITFFRDAQRTQPIQTERGSWSAANGKNEMKTDGVRTPEIYEYKILDGNTIHYVNTVTDPTADCQEDYAFTEHRIRN